MDIQFFSSPIWCKRLQNVLENRQLFIQELPQKWQFTTFGNVKNVKQIKKCIGLHSVLSWLSWICSDTVNRNSSWVHRSFMTTITLCRRSYSKARKFQIAFSMFRYRHLFVIINWFTFWHYQKDCNIDNIQHYNIIVMSLHR